MTCGKAQKWLYSTCFSYQTPKVVEIDSKLIGILNNLLLFGFTVIIIVYVFILNNGYQYIDYGARTSITCKVKGVTYSDSEDPRIGKRIWDSADFYIHPVGDGSFFVTTNIIATQNQVQTVCPEEPSVGGDCSEDRDCLPVGKSYSLGHGISTGVCNKTTATCMVKAWCPIEDDSLPNQGRDAVLKRTKDFTVYIKDHIYFPYYNVTRSNLIEQVDFDYVKSCRYHPKFHPHCPIFRLGDIVSLAVTHSEEWKVPVLNDSYFESMAIKGAVISISVIWDCNLDYPVTHCKPRYEFSRLDNYGGSDVAPGYNFRYSHNHRDGEVESRHLYKAFGILFLVKTEATARAFHLQTFLVTLGSSLALLGLAPFITEIVLLHIHKKRKLYKKSKLEPLPVTKDFYQEPEKF